MKPYCFFQQDPASYDFRQATFIVEASLVAKFERLPDGVAQVLKSNATFMQDGGPMRETILADCPLTKAELLSGSPEVMHPPTKVIGSNPTCCEFSRLTGSERIEAKRPSVASRSRAAKILMDCCLSQMGH